LSRIVTGDETWAHHYEPETKRQSMEWHHPQSPRKEKFKTTPSAGKVMITVFWDVDGVILVDMMARGETLRVARFEDDKSVILAVRTWLREQERSWYREGIHVVRL